MKAIYHRTVVRAGKTVEIIETYPTKFGDQFTRENYKKGSTSVQQEAYNAELAIRKLTRILNENFSPEDWFITLHYEKHTRPPTLKAAKTQLTYFVRKLGRRYKNAKIELKWVKGTAYGERGALHHHLVLTKGVPINQITALWKEHIGASIKARPPEYRGLYDTGEYSSLAAYLYGQVDKSKPPEDDFVDTFGQKHWTCSRNCKIPEPEPPKVINEIKWKEPPTAWSGYFIDTDSIKADVNPVNNRPYLFYRMVKLPPDFVCHDENGKRLTGSDAIKYFCRTNKEWIKKNWAELNPAGAVVERRRE